MCRVVNGSSAADSDRDIATDATAAAAAVVATGDDFFFPVTGVAVV
jgi:hypothetical protein